MLILYFKLFLLSVVRNLLVLVLLYLFTLHLVLTRQPLDRVSFTVQSFLELLSPPLRVPEPSSDSLNLLHGLSNNLISLFNSLIGLQVVPRLLCIPGPPLLNLTIEPTNLRLELLDLALQIPNSAVALLFEGVVGLPGAHVSISGHDHDYYHQQEEDYGEYFSTD